MSDTDILVILRNCNKKLLDIGTMLGMLVKMWDWGTSSVSIGCSAMKQGDSAEEATGVYWESFCKS